MSKTSSGAYPASPIQRVLKLFPGVKQPGHEGDHSPPFGAEVKNEYSYTSTLAICLHGVDRDNFTFYLYLLYSS